MSLSVNIGKAVQAKNTSASDVSAFAHAALQGGRKKMIQDFLSLFLFTLFMRSTRQTSDAHTHSLSLSPFM